MYSTFSWYFRTVRKARSKNRGCHISPHFGHARLMRLVAPTLMHSMKVDFAPTFARLHVAPLAEPLAKLVILPVL
jgi:predicted benzoate:H+ symporter BenE